MRTTFREDRVWRCFEGVVGDGINVGADHFRDDDRVGALLASGVDVEDVDPRAGFSRRAGVGEAVGAINRIPPKGEARSNMHAGGRPVPAKLTTRERDICTAIGPALKEKGLLFVGIDVIGDYMTEINVTSPTGLQEINRFDGTLIREPLRP